MPAAAKLDNYYSVRDLARIFKVHPETVRIWYRSGKLPEAKTFGRKLLWDPEQIQSLIATLSPRMSR